MRAGARRQRDREVEIVAAIATGVDIDALTTALALRLAAVSPPMVEIISDERGMISVRAVRGGGAGVDVALAVAGGEEDSRAPAKRVVDAGLGLLGTTQDEVAEVTTEPWPRRGSGSLPEPHAQLSADQMTVRLFYGSAAEPVLELPAPASCGCPHVRRNMRTRRDRKQKR